MQDVVSTRLGNHGRLVVPSEFRKQLNLKDGDQLQLSLVDGRLVITPAAALLKEFYELTEGVRSAPSDVVQELLDERREEAARE